MTDTEKKMFENEFINQCIIYAKFPQIHPIKLKEITTEEFESYGLKV